MLVRVLQVCLLWLFVVPGALGLGCQCSRGPVEESSKVIAEAHSAAAGATLVYDYFHGRQKPSYDSPVWDEEPTTRETLTLLVTPAGSEKPKRLKMRKQSNKEDRAPFGALEAALVIDPAGERVAYKLSDGDWELVYVTSSSWLFQAEPGTLAGAPSDDWSGVPTFRAALPSLLRAHGATEGIYEEVNRGRLLGHLRETLDEGAYVDVLAELASLDVALYGRWSYPVSRLSPEARTSLGEKLRAQVKRDPSPYLLERAFRFLDLTDPAFAELIHSAPAILSKDEELRLWTRDALTGYLEASAKLDLGRARATACRLVGEGIEAKTLPERLTQECSAAG